MPDSSFSRRNMMTPLAPCNLLVERVSRARRGMRMGGRGDSPGVAGHVLDGEVDHVPIVTSSK